LLLPKRPVLVHPLTPKETVMHHAHAEKENEENENRHEDGRNNSSHGSLLLRAGRQVLIFIHRSRLNSCPGAGRDPRKTFRLASHCLGKFNSWRAHSPRARSLSSKTGL